MSSDDRPKIWAQLEPEVYEYFFRKIFAGDRGIKQQLVARFFAALYEECRRQHIKAEWSLESGEAVELIMDNLNFQHAHRPRRPAHPSAKHKAQPPPGPDDGPGAEGVCDPASDPTREA